MIWKLRKTVEFSASHRLPNHVGPCANLHGHRWRVVVEVVAAHLTPSGMVVDFGDVRRVVMQHDHTHLNDRYDNPTAEVIAESIARDVFPLVRQNGHMIRVEVEESPGSSVVFELPVADEEIRRARSS